MLLFTHSLSTLARFVLLLCAVGAIGFLSTMATPSSATNGNSGWVLAQGMGVGMMGMPSMPSEPRFQKEQVIAWEKPTAPMPAWLDGKFDNNELEEGIRRTLNERLDIEFNLTPLSQIVAFISERANIPIILDEKALEEESITPEEPITIKREGVKVRNALLQILEPLQLTYKIELEGVMITSKKSSANIIRYYDLSYLFPNSGLIQELIMAIETMVEPSNWQEAGGTSSITTVGSMLLVSAPEETQLEVERLLRNISKQQPANMKPRVFQEKQTNKPEGTDNKQAENDKAVVFGR